jgi:hypothetical protein
MYKQMKDQAAQGIPPNWMVYVTVASADETAKKAKSLGGTVVAEPFDVATYGRMAVLMDLDHAVLSVWQPKDHIGVQVANEPGALSWCELCTNDTARAGKFYSQLFGWGLKTREDFPYVELMQNGHAIGGIFPFDEQMKGMPPYWGVYFRVADCDASTAKAKAMGAKVHVGPLDIPNVGRFAALQDPQGAGFSIIQLA